MSIADPLSDAVKAKVKRQVSLPPPLPGTTEDNLKISFVGRKHTLGTTYERRRGCKCLL